MKISHWLIVACLTAPLFACSDSDDNKAGTGGSSGSVINETGGTGATAGSGGSENTGGNGNTGGSTNSACDYKTGNATCDNCFATLCESQCVAFTSEPSSQALIQCYQGCGNDAACYDNCDQQFGQAASLFETFVGCVDQKCSSECGSGGGCQLTVQDATCDNCFQTECTTECESFMGEPTWETWLGCYQQCPSGDANCYTGCDNQYPQAASTGNAFFGCMEQKCATECGGSAGTDCGLTVQDAACDNCFDTKCNAECKAFAAAPNWQDWITCVGKCKDDACVDNCTSQYPQAGSTGEAFFDCMEQKCATECGGGSSGTDCGLTVQDAACDACFDSKCNAECKAFAAAPNWQDWITCVGKCKDDACVDNCTSQYPQAGKTGEAFFLCIDEKCATECG